MSEPKPKKFYWIQLVTRKQVEAALGDERPSRLRSQPVRRLLVVALSLSIILAAVGELVFGDGKLGTYVEGLALFATAVIYLVLRRSVRLLADAPTELLDERTVAIRDRAYTTAYWALCFVAGILAGILIANGLSVDPPQGHAMLFVFFLTMACLPCMVLGWTLPSESTGH